jgi:hypothetical protein
MFVMRAAVGVEANPWTGGKVALAHKEFSNTAEVSRKVRACTFIQQYDPKLLEELMRSSDKYIEGFLPNDSDSPEQVVCN